MYPKDEIGILRRSTPIAMALEQLHPSGLDVADIGCGAGALTLALAKAGARIVGIDPDVARINAARAAADAAGLPVRFEIGVAEDLPFADASLDIVVFSDSLHHVPIDSMQTALREAARVLRPGGTLYVAEPVPMGSYFEVQRLWNDETAVREHAYAAMRSTSNQPPALFECAA